MVKYTIGNSCVAGWDGLNYQNSFALYAVIIRSVESFDADVFRRHTLTISTPLQKKIRILMNFLLVWQEIAIRGILTVFCWFDFCKTD